MRKLNFTLRMIMLTLVIISTTSASAYSFVKDGIYYNITDSYNKTVEVTYKDADYYSMGVYSGSVTIPNNVYYNGSYYTVTRIGDRAFYNASGLKSLTIPNSVLSIGEEVFGYQEDHYCNGLTTITIPYSVTTIGAYAFYKCEALQTVVIGDGVTNIGEWAFGKCMNLKYLTIGSAVTSIGANAFWGAGYDPSNSSSTPTILGFSINAINPPTIQSNTFPNVYYSKVSVNVPNLYAMSLYKSVDYWRNFSLYETLNPYDFRVDGIYYLRNGTNTVKVTNNEGGYYNYTGTNFSYGSSVTIPSSVSYNGNSFTVVEIGEYAFYRCNLREVSIPKSVTRIGTSAFNNVLLSRIVIPNSVQDIADSAFYSRYYNFQEVIIGNGVNYIGLDAFGRPSTLTSKRAVACFAPNPPTAYVTSHGNHSNRTPFNYSTDTLYVSNVSSYSSTTPWNQMNYIRSLNRYFGDALQVNGELPSINFSCSGDYPWLATQSGGRTYVESGNKGCHSSTSTLTATMSVPTDGTLSFDFKAWGEGSSFDRCIFYIDGNQKFYYGARDNDWETYSVELTAGNHTLKWTYSKDGSENPTGDYFAVDNLKITLNSVCGDVDGSGNVNIDDVTALIDYLLGSNTSIDMQGADCDQSGSVSIDDVTALIDYLLSGHW